MLLIDGSDNRQNRIVRSVVEQSYQPSTSVGKNRNLSPGRPVVA